ncbi:MULTISPECIES: hypothetical protein [Pseudomonas syringae group]|uniref:Uncharacterized protein n=1 Tax=Pseudomonas syringae pv. ribicola TaxID=55398 RepID=A0A3M2W7I4_PSESI|nr:hypothetical protein [Pseudomonas syringae group genomosp. 3]RML47403.1 hypothetical protein ALQ95_03903 [Pseudomonas syringae pv. ribicola]
MKMIRALRQFSHYHAGNFDQFEERAVTDDIAEALIGMDLAEQVETVAPAKEKPTTIKKDKAT